MLATAASRAPAPAARPGDCCLLGRVRVTKRRAPTRRGRAVVRCGMLPVDPWAPTMDSQSIASQLFAVSLFPYLGFLYFMTRSKTAPGLTLFGFYFLLAFVGATIPAGIYAKVHYGTSLSNVDLLHGTAESLLTLTNLFIVLGLRGALRKLKDGEESNSEASEESKKKSSA
uniref:Uncharacterized protein n=1 Tax=Avena sativa TaxID=4498 RepID=A0ACD5U096_AVESA